MEWRTKKMNFYVPVKKPKARNKNFKVPFYSKNALPSIGQCIFQTNID